jgi:hypothetical protein
MTPHHYDKANPQWRGGNHANRGPFMKDERPLPQNFYPKSLEKQLQSIEGNESAEIERVAYYIRCYCLICAAILEPHLFATLEDMNDWVFEHIQEIKNLPPDAAYGYDGGDGLLTEE